MKKGSISIEKNNEKGGWRMKSELSGKWDRDMVRFAIERLVREFDKEPLVRWWELWK
jgi:hypothetical protein